MNHLAVPILWIYIVLLIVGGLFGYFKATLPLLLDERPGGLGRGQAIELARDLDRYVAEHGPRCCVIFPRMVVSATVP